jgi:predicted transcriptional regulator of viral defense system
VKYKKAFIEYFSKLKFFSFKDAKRFLLNMGSSEDYVKLFLHNQIKRHNLFRIGKGFYTFQNNEAVIGFRFSPFYYGLEYALTIRNLWTQMASPVIITTRNVRSGRREIFGANVIIRKISKKMFFGYEYINYSGIFVPVSDPEKTFIDFFYFKTPFPKECRIKLNKQKLKRYLKLCNPILRKRIEKFLSYDLSKNIWKRS